MKEHRTVVVTLTSAWAWVLASHFKVLHQSFICNGKGTFRRSILYKDRSCKIYHLHNKYLVSRFTITVESSSAKCYLINCQVECLVKFFLAENQDLIFPFLNFCRIITNGIMAKLNRKGVNRKGGENRTQNIGFSFFFKYPHTR